MAVFTIQIGAERAQLRPKLEAYRNIEAKLGFNLTEVFKLALAGHLKLQEATVVIHEGVGASDYDEPAIERCLFEAHYATNPEILEPMMRFLIALLYKPDLREKKYETEVLPVLESLTTI
jgi:hypothetical protein